MDNPDVMMRAIEMLSESSDISRIVFVQQRNYSYGSEEVFMLQEIADLHSYLLKQEKILSPMKLSIMNSGYISQRYSDVSYLLMALRKDPIACFFELNNFIKKERANLRDTPNELKTDQMSYIRLLEKFKNMLGNLKIIQSAEKYFGNYVFGSREIYHHFFKVDIIPNFTFTRLVSSLPDDASIVKQYELDEESVVTILKKKGDVKYFYHLMPPEYSLDENKQVLLNIARNVLIEHQPKAEVLWLKLL